MSKDRINNWKDMGVAYDPRADFIRYTDGTVNRWHNLERPDVVMENGHVVAFTFAATDSDKHNIRGTDNHGSKIIVVPFDSKAFDFDYFPSIDRSSMVPRSASTSTIAPSGMCLISI